MDKSKILMEFGNNVRAERSRKRLSQEELAEKAALNANYVGQIERGEYNPTLITILKLAKALEIDINKLLIFSE
jgi:transcriptional regulator with XRE-family HTH domain